MDKKTIIERLIEKYGIVEEGEIVTLKDLEGKEDVDLCREHLK